MLLLATRALQEQTQQGEAPPESFRAANFLGIDVQVGVVQAANRWAQQLGISHRLHFLAADVKGLRGQILKNYPGRVHAAAVQVCFLCIMSTVCRELAVYHVLLLFYFHAHR